MFDHLWIGGQWREASDGQAFRTSSIRRREGTPRSEREHDGRKAAMMRQAAPRGLGQQNSRASAPEVLRKAFELMMRDAERFAKLITLERKSLADSTREVAYAASSSAGTRRSGA